MVAGAQLELRLVPPRETVMAAVGAAAIRVEGPVERHPLNGVQCRTAGDLLIPGCVGPQLRLIQRRRRSLRLDSQRQGFRGWRALAEIEESCLIRHRFAFISPPAPVIVKWF